MKIKIISDGIGTNTKIINAETGEIIEGVTSIKWKCSVNKLATATLTFINIPVDVEGEFDNTQLGEKFKNVISRKT